MSELHEDLLEASDSRFHREATALQIQMFEARQLVRQRLLRIAKQRIAHGQTDREKVADEANDELNRAWQEIRAETYRKIDCLRQEKQERDQRIRVFTPLPTA